MATINRGRWTAQVEGDFVVFLIGARVRNPLKAPKALKLLPSMAKMLSSLSKEPAKGLLHVETWGNPLTGVIVQYWRSFEHLEAFARDPDDLHSKVWREWMASALQDNPGAGIWHETYRVSAGMSESVYQNMPAIGLAAAGTAVPVTSATDDARTRIQASRRGLADRGGEPTAD